MSPREARPPLTDAVLAEYCRDRIYSAIRIGLPFEAIRLLYQADHALDLLDRQGDAPRPPVVKRPPVRAMGEDPKPPRQNFA